MNLRAAFVFSLVIATPLIAQVEEKTPPAAAEAQTPRLEEAATKASEPARKLRLITNATTLNYLAKFDGAGNSTDSAVFEAAGLVGIGTATPANALHVKISDGAINVPLKLETSGTDSITGLSLKNDVRNWLIRVDGTDGDKFKIFDANAAAYRLTIDDAGRVGIGTTSPKANLHVYSEAVGDAIAGFGFDPSFLGLGSAMNIGYAGNSIGRGAGFFNVRPDTLAVAPNPSLRFFTADVERMIVTNTGWVGVGTSAPQQKLHVFENSAALTFLLVENLSADPLAAAAVRAKADIATTSIIAHATNRTISRVRRWAAGPSCSVFRRRAL